MEDDTEITAEMRAAPPERVPAGTRYVCGRWNVVKTSLYFRKLADAEAAVAEHRLADGRTKAVRTARGRGAGQQRAGLRAPAAAGAGRRITAHKQTAPVVEAGAVAGAEAAGAGAPVHASAETAAHAAASSGLDILAAALAT